MFDGVGAMQFVNSWGETARGLPLSLPPALDRAVLRARDPPQVEFPHHEFAQITDDDNEDDDGGDEEDSDSPLLHRSFRFTPASIARVKAAVALEGRACTTLKGTGRLRVERALGIRPSRWSKLLFAVGADATVGRGWRGLEPPPTDTGVVESPGAPMNF